MLKALCDWWCRLKIKMTCCKGQMECEKDSIEPSAHIIRPLDKYFETNTV